MHNLVRSIQTYYLLFGRPGNGYSSGASSLSATAISAAVYTNLNLFDELYMKHFIFEIAPHL